MTHSRNHITLSLTNGRVSICEKCLAEFDSYAKAARAALANQEKIAGRTWVRAGDYTGVYRGMTVMPLTVRCDLDTRPPADPQRDSDYAAGRFYWVCGPATPGAQPSISHEQRLTLATARDYANAKYGHRRDLAYDSVRIEQDSGALVEYAGPTR